jgi:DNA-binding NarL/FixJ family response regulator
MEVAAPSDQRPATMKSEPAADGIGAIRAIKARCPATQVLVLTARSEQDIFREAAAAGAVGYVLKDISPANLSNAIRAVHTGATMINPILARQMVEGLAQDDAAASSGTPRRPHRLTPREMNILIEVAQGLSDKEIAVKLAVSESRVKNCLRALYGRLNLHNRAHAAAFAVRRGLV